MHCWKCELHRRAADKVLIRADTRYWIIKRNLSRVPPGSEVEICPCNDQFSGIFGKFKGETCDYMLRSKTGFVIAMSTDVEDLAILISENEWYVEGPEELLDLLNLLADVR